MTEPIFEGGCLCGKTRYRATGIPRVPTHCHCVMCRKASGSAFVSWACFPTETLVFTRGEPKIYHSSDTAVRGFCEHCGTPLTFRYTATPDEVDITICTLDDPGTIKPLDHLWTRSRVGWLNLNDGLPEYRECRSLPS